MSRTLEGRRLGIKELMCLLFPRESSQDCFIPRSRATDPQDSSLQIAGVSQRQDPLSL